MVTCKAAIRVLVVGGLLTTLGGVLGSSPATTLIAQSRSTAAGDYLATQEAWRDDREARLLADDGWLTVSALHFLRQGENTFGSSPVNDLVLPEGPPTAGVFEMRGREVHVRAAEGETLSVDGEAVTAAKVYPREPRQRLVRIGAQTLFVHYSGDRLAIRVRDTNSEIRRSFTGLTWFPVDERFRVKGRFTAHEEPITVELPNILGDIEPFTSHGTVTLEVGGQEFTMLPMTSGDRLWFIFRDLTSGTDTYPAARFLYANAPDEEGWTVVDFNQAYNPPCAFNPHTTCPLPPPQNRLDVRVEAGEKKYH